MWKKHSKRKPDPETLPDEADALSPAEIQRDIRNRMIGLLARREHSRAELLHKLAERGYDWQQTESVLEQLAQENLQSDTRFAESFVYSRVQRGAGPQKIRAELRERGIEDVLIQAALDAVDADWYALAQQAWQKRFGQPPEDYAARAKQARFLQNRGFGHEHIQFALDSAK